MLLKLVEPMEFVVPAASNDQRVHLNEEFVKFEIAHLNFWLVHLLFDQDLFTLKLLPYFELLFLLLLSYLLPLDFFFVLLYFVLHFLHLLLILFCLLINFIFCFSYFLQSNRLIALGLLAFLIRRLHYQNLLEIHYPAQLHLLNQSFAAISNHF